MIIILKAPTLPVLKRDPKWQDAMLGTSNLDGWILTHSNCRTYSMVHWSMGGTVYLPTFCWYLWLIWVSTIYRHGSYSKYEINLGKYTHRRLPLPQRHSAPPATEPQPNTTHSLFRVLNSRGWFGVQIIGCTFTHILHSTFRVLKLWDWFGGSCF